MTDREKIIWVLERATGDWIEDKRDLETTALLSAAILELKRPANPPAKPKQ